MEHDFLEIIKTRRSCRKFQDRQISRVELDAVLEAGTLTHLQQEGAKVRLS